jgi:2,4-dienoyl-CoA reductase (NADPH2)
MWAGVHYSHIDDQGLHLVHREEAVCLPVSDIILCAGQNANSDLYDALMQAGLKPHKIGGSDKADGLDAKWAIDQACRLAAAI